MTTAARAFAEFAAALDWAAVPPMVQAKARDHLLDTLAVASAGAAEPESALLRRAQSRFAIPAQGCTVIATATRLPPVDAALVNGFAARIHTFDDTLEHCPVHPGSAIFAAALAAGEVAGSALADVLAGAVAGYEVVVRLADAFGPAHYDHGFHGTGTCNAPAAAVAAARAFRLDASRTAHAINLAAGAASGTRQYQIDGTIAHSALNGARAAATGVQAALQAEAGLTAPEGQLDGRWGMLTLLGDGETRALRVADLGTGWGLTRVGLKPYPTCRFTHGPIAVLRDLAVSHGITPDDVAAVEIRTFAQSASVSDRPRWNGRADAILSHQFAAAATLLNGPPALRDLGRLAESHTVRSLAARVSVVLESEFERRQPDDCPHLVRIVLQNGSVAEAFSARPPGGESAPLDAATIQGKARGLIDGALGAGRAERLLRLISAPERTSAAKLLSHLSVDVRHPGAMPRLGIPPAAEAPR